MTRDTTTEGLPEAVRVLLDEARECGGESRWGDALAKNLEALGIAEAANDRLGCAVAHRYVGLSYYRLDTAEHLERSAEHLRKARDIAASLGDNALALKIDNHLGATLRQVGRYDEADKVFRDALRATEARPELIEVRARLLGNLGAMLDELDQREQAADCYARYEEIVVSARDEERIANARGLVGRAALKRGDFDEAEWRFDEEARLSRSLRLAAREVEAALHHGRLAHARWREAPPDLRAERATEAHAHFARAIELNREAREAQTKMTTRLDLAYGEFLLDGGQLVESYAHFRDAKSGAVRMGIEVLASKADHGLAVTCRKAGLHG